MKVKFYAIFRSITGCKEIDYDGPARTIKELLDDFSRQYGEKFRKEIQKGEALGIDLIILVNGKHFAHLKGMDTEITPDDQVDIFPIVAGG